MAIKLDGAQKHLLGLVRKGMNSEGWAPVSSAMLPIIKKTLPCELVEIEAVGEEGRGRARLINTANNLLDAMAWL